MKIALLGDIGFFGRYSLANNEKVFEYFAQMSEYLKEFDYVVGNLEVPFIDNATPIGAKSAHVQSDPRNIELLKFLNVTHVCLANNHVYDFGQQGIDSTEKLLAEAGIHSFGLHQQDAVLEACKVAFHGYCCYSTNPYGLDKGVNTLNVPTVQSKMTHYHDKGYLNVVSVHAGFEHVNFPAYHDIRMARQLSNTCPYVYYGHHPHVLQGIEQHNGALLAYSMGNFCFDDVYTSKSDKPLVKQNDNNKSSAILELDVDNGKLVGHKTTGFYMAESSLVVGVEEINQQLADYSAFLDTEEQAYTAHRQKLMSDYIGGRKQMRDFNWYIKRLNLNSVIMIMRAKYNAWQHKRNVLAHLDASNP